MQIVDRSEMQEIDRITIEEFDISDELLMENAGFECVDRFIREFAPQKRDEIGILCGGGNNGGDGFVIARHLCRRGYRATVYLFVKREKLRGIALRNFERLSLFEIEVYDLSDQTLFDDQVSRLLGAQYLIDALLGIGFRGTPRGVVQSVIALVNGSGIPVISVDLPSGVDADGGQPDGLLEEDLALRATATYTIGCLKYGLIDYPGKDAAGRIEVLDIGFPRAAVRRAARPSTFIDTSLVRGIVPARRRNSHKGTYGHLAVLGGRLGYEGASLLASRAALRTGCGLVTLYVEEQSRARKPDEVIMGFLPDGEDADLANLLERHNAVLIGPGLGVTARSRSLVESAIGLNKRILIDADGLNTLAENPARIEKHPGDIVITPHIGEMVRLTGLKKEEIKRDKRAVALQVARRYRLTVVLKDAVTVVATAQGDVYMNDGGVAALSKGGSGDVLSGIIGSLLARGLSTHDAAVAGVYLHTECGRLAECRASADSVQAGDLIDSLPLVFRNLESFRPRGIGDG
jgi:NAD(P)H-hydrate epimerase